MRGASVAADATVDWFCPSGIGGEPALWHLLDPDGGAVRLGPVRDAGDAVRSLPPGEQHYLAGTNVVQTILRGAGGRAVSVTDVLPWEGPGQWGIGSTSSGRIVRLLTVLSGPVEIELEVIASGRPGGPHRVSTSGGVIAVDGLEIRAPMTFDPAPVARDSRRWRALRVLDTGEELAVTISSTGHEMSPEVAHRVIDDSIREWRSWSAGVAYDGPFREAVERSLLAVRSLTGPGGAPLAAGTTSLPRRSGGERTSDDRFVSVRDICRAVRVFASAGLSEDAETAEMWLRRAADQLPRPWPQWVDPDIQPTSELVEMALQGWRRSQPVVTGRADSGVDVGLLGPVASAYGASSLGPGGHPDAPGPLSGAWGALTAVTDWTVDRWAVPDAGRWEIAEPTRMYVAGRLDAWFGLDRMARLAREINPLDLDAVGWQQEARGVLAWLEKAALAPDGGLRMDGAPAAGNEADSALLSVAWQGPWPSNHEVVKATVQRVLDRLGSGVLVYRYGEGVDDGRPGADNPDLAASFDAVHALARLGRWEEAHERMEGLVGILGPLGLPAQTADPVDHEVAGNLPSTTAALALVEAALALTRGPL